MYLYVNTERIELFLELFGNTLIRSQTSKYLQKKCEELIKWVTAQDYSCSPHYSLIDTFQTSLELKHSAALGMNYNQASMNRCVPLVRIRLIHLLALLRVTGAGSFALEFTVYV